MYLRRGMYVGVVCCVASTVGMLVACGAEPSSSGRQPDTTTVVERLEVTRAIAAWNAIALQTTAAGPFSPPREARAMAMVSAAVFDAVNSIDEQFEPYAARIIARPGASLNAAAAAAAHRVLRSLYPGAGPSLETSYDSALAAMSQGVAKEAGIAAGEAAAGAVLTMRSGDRANDLVNYVPGSVAGSWRPTPPAFASALEPAWGRVTPFVLDSGSQFRPAAPPALGSTEYMRDLMEIVEIGVSSSPSRLPTQTETARFWITTAAPLWNQIARQLAVSRSMDPVASARLFFMLNAAGADALISAWDAKFTYNQWRPVTAIRRGIADGTLKIQADTNWNSLIVTPPFPDYPAGHTAYGGAAETVLQALLSDHSGEFSLTSSTAGGVTHRFQAFSQVGDEVVNARVWGGVHWRTSSTAGRELGRRVGELALLRLAKRR